MDDEIYLNERIDVIAMFGRGISPCMPIKFRRKGGREIVITEVGLHTPDMRGRKTVHLFDVTDGEADYRLEFDGEGLRWRLTMEADHYGRQ